MSVCMEKMGLSFFPLSITILKRNAVSSQFNFHHVDCKKLCQLKMLKLSKLRMIAFIFCLHLL